MKVFNPLNMLLNEIQSVKAHIIAGNPGSPEEGQFWYDSVLKRLKFRTDAANLPVVTVAGDLADGSIANGKLTTNPLARANHTGDQLASTISDFDTQVRTNRLDQMAAPTASVSLNSQKVTNLADATASGDAVNFGQLQSAIGGLGWKDSVRVSSIGANVVIATALENGDSLDGITLATGDRVLLKDQTAPAENGIYVVAASGAASRSLDADTALELEAATVMVEEGSNSGTQWTQTSDNFTLGSGAVTWAQIGAGSSYTAGDGLTLTGNDFDVGAGTGIVVDATNVNIDTTVVARFYQTTFDGDGAEDTFTITHSLGNLRPLVQVWDVDASPDEVVMVDVRGTGNSNTVDIVFGTIPANGATYGVTVVG